MGLREFKPQQMKAIECIVRGEDVFVTLPTGFGKSAIYQSLPFCASVLADKSSQVRLFVLIVSPLIALMRDQVASLSSRSVRAAYLCRSCPENDDGAIVNGEYSHLFTSPKAILKDSKWRKMLLSSVYTKNLIAIAIDEAHCIVKW